MTMAASKATFLRSQMRKGRSKPQAESDWKASRRMKAKARAKKKNPARPRKKSGSATKPRAKAKTRGLAKAKKRNPGIGSVPVLLMNPAKGTRRKGTVAKRRRRRGKPKRRARRRNPRKSWDLLGVGVAAVGGGTVAGATFLLDGTELKMVYQNAGVALGSALLGVALSKHAPNLAKGIAASGLGIGTLGLLRQYVAPPFGEKQVTRRKEETTDAVRTRLGSQGRKVKALMMNAVRAKLGCSSEHTCAECSDYAQCEMSAVMSGAGRMPAAAPALGNTRWGGNPGYNMGAVAANLQGVNVHR